MIPLEKSVLIQYCDMQAEIKELRRLTKMTEERLEKIEKEGAVSDVAAQLACSEASIYRYLSMVNKCENR